MHKINIKVFLISLVSLFSAFGGHVLADDAPAKKPNILFFLIDDMGYSDLSCFGGQRAHTPYIDRAAKEGQRFTQFYVNAPICSPSRIAFTTGQYPLRWGITSYLDNRKMDHDRGIKDWLDPSAPTLAHILHDAGYYTAHVGKWHMGGQRDVADAPHIPVYGFDRALTTFEGLADERILPTFEPYDPKDPFKYPQVRTAASLPGPYKMMPRYKVSEVLVDRALDEIKVAHDQSKPFYINLWPDDVHSPCEAPPEMRGDDSSVDNYVGVLDELDRQFGRIFDKIKSDPDLRDNTIILIASDNGPEVGLGTATGMRGSKGQLYEGGIHLPLIVWAPHFASAEAIGTTNSQTVIAGMDFAPSILAMTHLATPTTVKFDGSDMSDTLLGKSSKERDGAVMWIRPPDRPGPHGGLPDLAMREGKWKLLIKRDGSKVELFDIAADPGEKKNLAKENPELTEKMAQRLKEWEKSTTPH